MVPLRHRLSNGDTVEVITNSSQYPRKDWLEFVASGKARSRIRHAVQGSERERARELGREIVERELRKRGRSLNKLMQLSRDDDLIDIEFNVICRREGYRMLEVPIFSNRRHGGRSTTGYFSAAKLYWGAVGFWRSLRNGDA